jgi:hypothetical protein
MNGTQTLDDLVLKGLGPTWEITMSKKIFVGSSKEALGEAREIGEVLEGIEGVKPIIWTSAFKTGGITFLEIERLTAEVDGAIFIASPDDHAVYRGENVKAPRDNVIFEYGFFVSALTRRRVALCRYNEAKLPSDFGSVTNINMGAFSPGKSLTQEARRQIIEWVGSIAPISPGLAATKVFHGLSGVWELDIHFTRWRGIELGALEHVSIHSKMSLNINPDLGFGSGFSVGALFGTVKDCSFRFEKADSLKLIETDMQGNMLFHAEMLIRQKTFLDGVAPQADGFEERLEGHNRFEVRFSPTESEKTIKGTWNTFRFNKLVSDASVTAVRRSISDIKP